jgi:hypothetical protein
MMKHAVLYENPNRYPGISKQIPRPALIHHRGGTGYKPFSLYFLFFFFLPSREQLSLPMPQPPLPVRILNRIKTTNTRTKIPDNESNNPPSIASLHF